jgi:cell division protein FtsX
MTDILIHVHPDLPADTRAKVEEDIQAHDGVVSVHFSHQEHPHALVVEYDPDTIQTSRILEAVRHYDPAATMVGL